MEFPFNHDWLTSNFGPLINLKPSKGCGVKLSVSLLIVYFTFTSWLIIKVFLLASIINNIWFSFTSSTKFIFSCSFLLLRFWLSFFSKFPNSTESSTVSYLLY